MCKSIWKLDNRYCQSTLTFNDFSGPASSNKDEYLANIHAPSRFDVSLVLLENFHLRWRKRSKQRPRDSNTMSKESNGQ